MISYKSIEEDWWRDFWLTGTSIRVQVCLQTNLSIMTTTLFMRYKLNMLSIKLMIYFMFFFIFSLQLAIGCPLVCLLPGLQVSCPLCRRSPLQGGRQSFLQRGRQSLPDKLGLRLSLVDKSAANNSASSLVDCPTQLICTWIFICIPWQS